MPRLIDLDELEKDTEWDEYFDGFTSYSSVMIDEAEIVEAIPVEWIKEWCNKQNSKSLEERLLKRYGVLTMLEDWEKENAED